MYDDALLAYGVEHTVSHWPWDIGYLFGQSVQGLFCIYTHNHSFPEYLMIRIVYLSVNIAMKGVVQDCTISNNMGSTFLQHFSPHCSV